MPDANVTGKYMRIREAACQAFHASQMLDAPMKVHLASDFNP